MLVDVDQPTSPPPDAGKPRVCTRDGRRAHVCRHAAPPIEPPGRRKGIEPARAPKVLAKGIENVDERIPDLARRSEQTRVVSISPGPSGASQGAVHGLRDPDRQPAHPTLELRRPVRLYEQMQVIRLHAEVQDAEPRGASRSERVSCDTEKPAGPERGHDGGRPQRHMGGTVPIVRHARAVGDRAPPGSGLAPGAVTATSPGAKAKLELLHATCHLNLADVYPKLASLSVVRAPNVPATG